MGAPLKNIKRIKLFLLFVHAVFETLISEMSPWSTLADHTCEMYQVRTARAAPLFFPHSTNHIIRPRLYGEKSSLGKRVTLPSESTLGNVYMRKKLTPLPEPRGGRACSDRLALTELTRLGEPKCSYGEKLARLGGWPYHRKKGDLDRRVTLLAEPTFCFSCKRFVKFCKEM